MAERYIAFAVPIFFLLIGVEALIGWRRGKLGYSFQDAITNLSCGIGQQILGIVLKTVTAVAYIYLYDNYAFTDIAEDSVLAWIGVVVLVDFLYYWFHRAGHRVNAVWATHIVHHQSEEYNLSVALRQSWFAGLQAWAFYLPAALVGFPPLMFVLANTAITLYQFWIHTEQIGRMGPLEWVFNTPSHHRVHHGINPAYIDKNYAGVLIIWDRLFGTFQAEEEEVVYGTVKPFASWNPWWANVHYWVETAQLARRCPRLIDKLRVWVMPPEWRPAELGGKVTIPPVTRATRVKYAPYAPRSLKLYVLVQFTLVLVASVALLVVHGQLTPVELGVAVSLNLIGLLTFGGLFEAKPWALGIELARLAAMALCVGWVAHGLGPWLALAAVPLPIFAVWLLSSSAPSLPASAAQPPTPIARRSPTLLETSGSV